MVCVTIVGRNASGHTTWSMQKEAENRNQSLLTLCQEKFDDHAKFCIEIQPKHYEVLDEKSTLNDAMAVHSKYHSHKFGHLSCIEHTFKGNKPVKLHRVWLCFSSGDSKFLVLVRSTATYQQLLEMCNSLPNLKGHEIIHCDSDKHCIRDGQELRRLCALKINNKMDANDYLTCVVTHGEQHMFDENFQGIKATPHVLLNEFGAYIRRPAKITNIPHRVSAVASSRQFPICMCPIGGFFHNVDFVNEDTVGDVIEKFETTKGKLFTHCVSTKSAVKNRVCGKQLKRAMNSTEIGDKEMEMPAFQFLSRLKQGEIIVASSYSEILILHKGETKMTTKVPEFNASCCTLGNVLSKQKVKDLPADLLFYKEDKDGEFNVWMQHQLVQDLCIVGESIQLNVTSEEEMNGVGLGNKKFIPILFQVDVPRHHPWIIWDVNPCTSMESLHQKWKSRVDDNKMHSMHLLSTNNKPHIKDLQNKKWNVKELMIQMTPGMCVSVTTGGNQL